MSRHKKLRKREARKAPAAAPRERPRQPAIARPHVTLDPVEPERDVDVVAEITRDDLAGVIGEARPWQGSDER